MFLPKIVSDLYWQHIGSKTSHSKNARAPNKKHGNAECRAAQAGRGIPARCRDFCSSNNSHSHREKLAESFFF